MSSSWLTDAQIESLGTLLVEHIHSEKTIRLLRFGRTLGVAISIHGLLALEQLRLVEFYSIDPDGSVHAS